MKVIKNIVIGPDQPQTIRVRIKNAAPGFSLAITRNRIPYYYREVEGSDTININLKNAGDYEFSQPVELLYQGPLKIVCPVKYNELPKFERNYPLPDRWEKDIQIGRSPARMFAKHGIVETGERFNLLPEEWKVYILLHELAHSKYKTEWKADTLALYWFCHLGYNHSQGLYALSKVLHQSPDNKKRIMNIYNRIKP